MTDCHTPQLRPSADEEVLNRLVRIETRLVRLMLHLGMKPQTAQPPTTHQPQEPAQ